MLMLWTIKTEFVAESFGVIYHILFLVRFFVSPELITDLVIHLLSFLCT